MIGLENIRSDFLDNMKPQFASCFHRTVRNMSPSPDLCTKLH